MSEQLFELVFYGGLVPGAELAATKQQLAQLFKASDAQVEKMFSGQRVVLKSKLDEATSEKYLSALLARGAKCKVEPLSQSSQGSSHNMAQSSPSAETATPGNQAQQVEVSSSPELPLASSGQHQSGSLGSASPKQTDSERMSLAGDKADALLENSTLGVDPLGVDLGVNDTEAPPPELTMQDSLSLAPVGADIGDKKSDTAPPVPDVSHLNLQD
jgi:hypothetical protein